MNKTLNTIKMMLPERIKPIAEAKSGFLRGLLWESEEGCHFVICREDPETGEFDFCLRPSDVENVASLTAMIANGFHMILDGELSDDLGCLAQCLSSSLGFDFDDEGVPQPATRVQ